MVSCSVACHHVPYGYWPRRAGMPSPHRVPLDPTYIDMAVIQVPPYLSPCSLVSPSWPLSSTRDYTNMPGARQSRA